VITNPIEGVFGVNM